MCKACCDMGLQACPVNFYSSDNRAVVYSSTTKNRDMIVCIKMAISKTRATPPPFDNLVLEDNPMTPDARDGSSGVKDTDRKQCFLLLLQHDQVYFLVEISDKEVRVMLADEEDIPDGFGIKADREKDQGQMILKIGKWIGQREAYDRFRERRRGVGSRVHRRREGRRTQLSTSHGRTEHRRRYGSGARGHRERHYK